MGLEGIKTGGGEAKRKLQVKLAKKPAAPKPVRPKVKVRLK